MADWTPNTIMLWDGNKITDHGRQSLNMSVERIGTDTRMADGTLRRFHVGNKRTWSTSWDMIPSTKMSQPVSRPLTEVGLARTWSCSTWKTLTSSGLCLGAVALMV